eukprot:6049078-Pleurochrysis_carterae.AAC.1
MQKQRATDESAAVATSCLARITSWEQEECVRLAQDASIARSQASALPWFCRRSSLYWRQTGRAPV